MMLHRLVSVTGRALGAIMIGCVHVYRLFFSPLFPPSCRHMPTCSGYAISAVRTHGPILGFLLTSWRLLRCHPWGGMGYDPVPEPGFVLRWLRRLMGRDVAASGTSTQHHHF